MRSDTTSAPHRIQRQVIELALPAGMAAPESQERLAREWRDRVLPALSRVFDATAGADRVLRLGRLEIDLGTVTGSDWAPRLGERLLERIAERLAQHPAVVAMPAASQGMATAREPMRAFLFFLAHGRLPWWGDRPEGGFRATFGDPASIDWTALRAVLRTSDAARGRVVDSLADAQLAAGVTAWRGVPAADAAMRAWTPADAPPSAVRAWRRGYWSELVAWAVRGPPGDAAMPPIAALRALRRDVFGAASSAPRAAPGAAATSTWPSTMPPDAADAALPPTWRAWARDTHVTPSPRPAANDRTAARDTVASPPMPRPASPLPQPAPLTTEDTPLYVPAAGLVLLYPFIATLFRDRGLLAQSAGSAGTEKSAESAKRTERPAGGNTAFADAAARSQAVRLLGLLAFGSVDVPEYDLVLPKRLCGHPLADPLEPSTLVPTDIAACDELLAAVLGHWRALRSSSADWLRSQFLLRDGRLDEVDGGCRLTVERRAQDVLLARLPWGIGVVGLPWLAERIFVRWID